jgi:hypothetical protein
MQDDDGEAPGHHAVAAWSEWAMMRSKAAARLLVPSIAFHAAKVG